MKNHIPATVVTKSSPHLTKQKYIKGPIQVKKTLSCNSCDKKFTTLDQAKEHNRTYTVEKYIPILVTIVTKNLFMPPLLRNMKKIISLK